MTATRPLQHRLRSVREQASRLRGLIELYGRHTALRLVATHLRSLVTGRVNAHIDALIADMGAHRHEGSATRPGWLYHEYALPDTHGQVHRGNTAARLDFLKRHVPVAGQRILDLGCSTGGMSLGFAALGASHVVGIDHDPAAIRVGQAMAAKYGLAAVDLRCGQIPGCDLPHADLVVWLSQWMWTARQIGLEAAKALLFAVPHATGAARMVFESAADDGKAAIAGATQSDIEKFLREWSPYEEIRNLGAFPDNWRLSGKERMVFSCSRPTYQWRGKQAVITRVAADAVVKEYRPDAEWARKNEIECLTRLAGHPNFPRLLGEGDHWLKVEWAGPRATADAPLSQLDDVVRGLASAAIVHRDICPENLMSRDGRLFLIDFEWAVVGGVSPPAIPKSGLGRGYYVYGQWDDAAAAEKVRRWFAQSQG